MSAANLIDRLDAFGDDEVTLRGAFRAGKETKPSQLFEKGTPLDLYIFRERA
jgi:hypothetical protein